MGADSYTVDNGVVIYKAVGAVDIHDTIALTLSIFRDPQVPRPLRLLRDTTASQAPDPADVSNALQVLKSLPYPDATRIAILVTRSIDASLSSIFKLAVRREVPELGIEIFSEREQALSWLTAPAPVA